MNQQSPTIGSGLHFGNNTQHAAGGGEQKQFQNYQFRIATIEEIPKINLEVVQKTEMKEKEEEPELIRDIGKVNDISGIDLEGANEFEMQEIEETRGHNRAQTHRDVSQLIEPVQE